MINRCSDKSCAENMKNPSNLKIPKTFLTPFCQLHKSYPFITFLDLATLPRILKISSKFLQNFQRAQLIHFINSTLHSRNTSFASRTTKYRFFRCNLLKSKGTSQSVTLVSNSCVHHFEAPYKWLWKPSVACREVNRAPLPVYYRKKFVLSNNVQSTIVVVIWILYSTLTTVLVNCNKQ